MLVAAAAPPPHGRRRPPPACAEPAPPRPRRGPPPTPAPASAGRRRRPPNRRRPSRRPADGSPTDPGRRLLLARGAAIFAGLTAAGIDRVRRAHRAQRPPRSTGCRSLWPSCPAAWTGCASRTVSDIHLGPLAGRAHTERIVAVDQLGRRRHRGGRRRPGRRHRRRAGRGRRAAARACGRGTAPTSSPATTSTTPASDEWVAEVERLGMRPLRNERRRARAGIDLAGVNDLAGERYRARRPGLRRRARRPRPGPAGGAARPPAGRWSRTPPSTASTCSCPGTPTAARSCRST